MDNSSAKVVPREFSSNKQAGAKLSGKPVHFPGLPTRRRYSLLDATEISRTNVHAWVVYVFVTSLYCTGGVASSFLC